MFQHFESFWVASSYAKSLLTIDFFTLHWVRFAEQMNNTMILDWVLHFEGHVFAPHTFYALGCKFDATKWFMPFGIPTPCLKISSEIFHPLFSFLLSPDTFECSKIYLHTNDRSSHGRHHFPNAELSWNHSTHTCWFLSSFVRNRSCWTNSFFKLVYLFVMAVNWVFRCQFLVIMHC